MALSVSSTPLQFLDGKWFSKRHQDERLMEPTVLEELKSLSNGVRGNPDL